MVVYWSKHKALGYDFATPGTQVREESCRAQRPEGRRDSV